LPFQLFPRRLKRHLGTIARAMAGTIDGARDASDLVNPLMGKLKKEPE